MALQARGEVESASPQARDARALHGQGREGALPRRARNTVSIDAEERRKQWVDQAPDRVRTHARAHARLARRLHLHQGDGRARRRGPRARARPQPVDRAAVDHRVGPRAPVARMDRRLQDGRPDHPRLRHGPDPGVPRHPRGHRRPDPGRLRRERDPGGGRDAAARRASPPTTTCRAATGTRCASSSSTSTSASTSRRIRCPSAAAASTSVPTWDFPGNLKVEKMLRRAETFVDLAEKVVTHMPKSKTMRDAVNRVDRDKARVDFIERYSDLYGMYTETEVVYTDARVQSLWGSLSAGGPGALPVRCRRARLEVLPAGRALPGRDAEPARALAEGPREADGEDPPARRHRAGGVRHGGHDHLLQRGRVLRVGAVRRPDDRGLAGRARERVRPDPRLPADRPSRSRRLPADVLPALRGRERRGRRRAGAAPRGRVHAAEGLARGCPADPRAPGRRPPHGHDHGGGRAVRATVRAAVRHPDRRRAGGARRALHRVHERSRRWSGRRAPRG